MKISSFSTWSPLSGRLLLLSLPLIAVLHGCGGGSSSNPVTPLPEKTSFVIGDNGSSFLADGTVNFTHNQNSTGDELEGSIRVEGSGSSSRTLRINISATDTLKVGQTFQVGTRSNATTSLRYIDSIGIAYSGWRSDNSGQVVIVALSETALKLRVKAVKMDRYASDGPLGPGEAFILNGTLVVPNPS